MFTFVWRSNSLLVLDHDIGRVLDKVRMTSSDVRRAILEIVHSYNSISEKARRVGLTLKLAGGVKRAVEILKYVILVRAKHMCVWWMLFKAAMV